MHPVKYEAMVVAFEKLTGVQGSWTMPEYNEKRYGFAYGFNAGLTWLAEEHRAECNEDRPIQEWIKAWAKA